MHPLPELQDLDPWQRMGYDVYKIINNKSVWEGKYLLIWYRIEAFGWGGAYIWNTSLQLGSLSLFLKIRYHNSKWLIYGAMGWIT